MKCSVRQNFHSLPHPFVNLFKLDTLVFDFNFQWFSLGMEEEGVQWLEWKGYFLQPNNSTKDFVNKCAKAKILMGAYSVQCTLMTQIIFTPWLWSFTTPVALPIFFQLLTQEMLILFFFLREAIHILQH